MTPRSRLIVHGIGGFLAMIALALIVAAVALPNWLTYENTYLHYRYYLGLWEYCWKQPITGNNGQQSSIFKCEFNAKVQANTIGPNTVRGSVQNISLGLMVFVGLLHLTSVVCASTGWICKRCCGICVAVTWALCSLLAIILNVVAVAYFALSVREKTNMIIIDPNSVPSGTQYYISVSISFYLACGSIIPTVVAFIFACVAICGVASAPTTPTFVPVVRTTPAKATTEL